jgi:hypothetical protein
MGSGRLQTRSLMKVNEVVQAKAGEVALFQKRPNANRGLGGIRSFETSGGVQTTSSISTSPPPSLFYLSTSLPGGDSVAEEHLKSVSDFEV